MSKNSELEKLIGKISKQYGANSIYTLDNLPNYDVITTGTLSLDYALGIGGLPSNRVIEIFGKESTGKTTLVLHIINEYLKAFTDKVAIFLDMEHKLERDWAKKFVQDWDRLIIVKPSDAEQAINMYRDFAVNDLIPVCLQVWDSIGGAPTAKGLEKDANITNFGGNSMIITQFAKYAATLSGKYGFTTIGINQERQDMGGYNRPTTPSGDAWKHACILRIRLVKGKKGEGEAFEKINNEEIKVGYQVFATIVKSQVGAPGRVANYWFYNVPNSLGFGIDHIEETARLAKLTGVVEGSNWLKHPALPGGQVQGLAKLTALLKADESLRLTLASETMARMQSGDIDMSEIVPTIDVDTLEFNGDHSAPMGAKTIQQVRKENEERNLSS